MTQHGDLERLSGDDATLRGFLDGLSQEQRDAANVHMIGGQVLAYGGGEFTLGPVAMTSPADGEYAAMEAEAAQSGTTMHHPV